MNSIQPFQSESINKLKLWLTNMSAKGHTKFYEIFVDTIRVVQKTDNIDYFDEYETWVDENTRSMRIHVYNTQASHRSQVFEYRTSLLQSELSKDDLLRIAEKKTDELLKRISDAEEYIQKLESENDAAKTEKSAFDLDTILSYAGPLLKQNPQLLGNLGLSSFFGGPNEKSEIQSQESEVTFKRKSESVINGSFAKPEVLERLTNIDKCLNEEQRSQLLKLVDFFTGNPEYIKTVFEMVTNEDKKLAA